MLIYHVTKRKLISSEQGTALLGALILAGVTMLLLAYVMSTLGTGAQTVRAQRERESGYYEGEYALNKVTSWLRTNSKNMLTPFLRGNFYRSFDRSAPSSGTNDSSGLKLPTRLKLQGTSLSAILVSDPILATAAFPATTAATGASFDSQAQFRSALTGTTLIRATLMDAIPVTASGDYGDTDLGHSAPGTDFYPIWRVDSLTDVTSGTHLYTFVVGDLVASDVGFYGQNSVNHNRKCDSYRSNDGAYGGGNRYALCPITSVGSITLKSAGYVYGSVSTNAALTGAGKFRKRVCADFTAGCPVSGMVCEGASCQVQGLGTAPNWSTFCPTDQGNLTVSTNRSLTIASDDPRFKCWKTVTVKKNMTLTLVTSGIPYFFNSLVVQAKGKVLIQPTTPTSVVQLNLNAMKGAITPAILDNSLNKPYQLELNYWSTTTLKLTANTPMKMSVYSPKATVALAGTADFFGSIRAKILTTAGAGLMHYDESGSAGAPDDITYKMIGINQQ